MDKKKILLTILMLNCGCMLFAQKMFTDPLVDSALRLNGKYLRKEQQKTNHELEELNKKQTMVQGLLYGINNIQKKVHEGLTEVSGAVTSANSLVRTYENLTKAVTHSRRAITLASRNPHHLLLATEQMDRVEKYSREIYADIASVLTSSPKNLMTSGERNIILQKIQRDSRHLYISAIILVQQLERIKRIGLLNMINPFGRGYSNRDLRIFTDMMERNDIFN